MPLPVHTTMLPGYIIVPTSMGTAEALLPSLPTVTPHVKVPKGLRLNLSLLHDLLVNHDLSLLFNPNR